MVKDTNLRDLEEALELVNHVLNSETLTKREYEKLDTISGKLFNLIDALRNK